MEQIPTRSARVVELDALRGLAALAVVFYHLTAAYQQQIGHVQPLPFLFQAGNYGVHLFFIISGFVIFMTLERTRSAMDFAVSRFSRLFPAYWAAICITALVVYSIGLPVQRLPPHQLLLNFSMLQQILGAEHLDGSYWTLEVELFFYAQMLFWFVAGLLGRIRWIIAAWLIMAVGYGLITQQQLHFSYTIREMLILRHIPFFALGILFYRMRSQPQERRLDGLMVLACLLAIGCANPPVFLLVALACCAVFALFLGGHVRWLASKPFAFLGAISYSLYLLHQAIGFAVMHEIELAGMPSVAAVFCALALVLGLATLLTWSIERPAMRAIRNWWKQRHAHTLQRTTH